ncbi:hypothetical protein F441_06859 [Phytophthora nicotianae CJ01A1]|uniref:Uncharacterized protein n=2 Tax=Phytophthora nicotianae TaxID=4792 RepID=W2RFA8_PHYN3|nr:hypothetical protein PPTG_20994 [Phytophthora nicotianae INRA-310]ETN23339.1 hypothetical protein PPTG_20994 [Phytophthora nicotianae INRA-310]ETP19005.1 hypothetical protein F441_06859 [Phytophthora nicotianae CJ01A1]
MTPHRSCMLPANFETIAFLRVNREMWNAASLIEQVITTAVHFLQFRSLLYFPRPAANYLYFLRRPSLYHRPTYNPCHLLELVVPQRRGTVFKSRRV